MIWVDEHGLVRKEKSLAGAYTRGPVTRQQSEHGASSEVLRAALCPGSPESLTVREGGYTLLGFLVYRASVGIKVTQRQLFSL